MRRTTRAALVAAVLVGLTMSSAGAASRAGDPPSARVRVTAADRAVLARAALMPRDPVQPPPVALPVFVERPLYGTAWPGNMPYYGGPVLRKPRIYLVFWGWPKHDSVGYAARLTAFFRGVGGSPWLGVATEFYDVDAAGVRRHITNPRNQLAGVWYDPKPPAQLVFPEGSIRTEALRAAAHFRIKDLQNATVLVASPPNRNPSGFAAGEYCAWHSWSSGLAFINLPYVLNADSGCGSNYVHASGQLDGLTIVAGHEYAEAITDPMVSFSRAWTDVTGQENADKCEWIPPGRPGGAVDITLSTGTFPVQQTWSNEALAGLGDCTAS